ncbi:hypothetical protein [Priestia megaterium]|uniref:hypothetical protein n=1 Tax=Priestia megaterium TaxID=1404 RepID=UPI000BA78000|nr:hypothetical protein [Priestia megaterium]PAK47592.1 hypothetical protein CHH47_19290 [Priestia megaterium]
MSFDVSEALQRFDDGSILSNDTLEYLSAIGEKNYRGELFLQLYKQEVKKLNQGNKKISFRIRRLFKRHLNLNDIMSEGERINKHFDNIGAYSSAVIHNLHTIGDSLGKILNEHVLVPNNLSPEDYLYRINNKLKSNSGIAPNLSVALDNFVNSYEWKYINTFDNTEKHQKMIHFSDNRELGEKIIIPTYRTFGRTTYTRTPTRIGSYSEVFWPAPIDKIMIDYRKIIYSHIDTVFEELYNYLRI